MISKWLAFGIILLFVGVTIAPSINFQVVKASTDDDLVEVTTQACGIQGYGDTTVKLTREQYQHLESYLVDFRARLNQTTTREEAVPIFKDAVVELDKYGLLPKGMSVERAQRLVSYDLMKNTPKLQSRIVGMNFLCLVTGQLNYADFVPLYILPFLLSIPVVIFIIGLFALMIGALFHDQNLFVFVALTLISLYGRFIERMIQCSHFIPVSLFSYTGPLWCGRNPVGWLASVGLLGFQSWNGIFSTLTTIFGFTGLKLFTLYDEETFFIGTAFYLKIEI